jgi:hypothetical protein
MVSSGSSRTARKLSRPTNSGAVTRLVCWTLMITDLTIGHHEKSPNTSSIGSRNTIVLAEPRARVRSADMKSFQGLRRDRGRGRPAWSR